MSPRVSPLGSLRARVAASIARLAETTGAIALRYTVTEQSDRVTRLAWSPDGRLLAVPSRDGSVRVHAAREGALRATLAGHEHAVMGVAWSPDGRLLASIGCDDRVLVWNVATGEPRQVLECSEGSLTGVAWCPRGGMLAVTSESGRVLRFRQRIVRRSGARSLLREEPLPSAGALHVAWAPDGLRIAVGARDGRVRVFDPWSGERLAELAGHEDAAVIVAWAPDGRSFASGSKDATIRFWHAGEPRALGTLRTHRDHVTAIAFSPDGTLLASKGRDGVVLLWRPDPWRPVAAIAEPGAEIGWSVGLAFHPREPHLATLGEGDRQVRVWRIDASRLAFAGLTPDETSACGIAPWREPLAARGGRRVVLV